MSKIKVVDACMGRGKTSAAAAYMLSSKNEKRFLYITPFLDEVDRICSMCDFSQPDDDKSSKLSNLKTMLMNGENVASTHALFYSLDDEALGMIRRCKYSIIIDESINTVRREPISARDFDILVSNFMTVDEDGKAEWTDNTYDGKFTPYMLMARAGSLYVKGHVLLYVMNPSLLDAFDEVIMMTYMFDGQYQKAYLDYFGYEYQMCGVYIDDSDEENIKFSFTSLPDEPPDKDYRSLITIVDEEKLNDIGKDIFSLSKGWFEKRSKDHQDIKTIRANMNTFLRRRGSVKMRDVIWTCFKSQYLKIVPKDGRFKSGFVSLTSRATNKYRDRTTVVYLANRFADPCITNFFAGSNISIDGDHFALSEMLQFIWRSAIRDDKPIIVYIPSRRMRDLLINWIDERCKGE